MRVAPIGLLYFLDTAQALENAAASSDVTYPYLTCAECCMIYTKLLVKAFSGASKEDLAAKIAAGAFQD
jgi:ADP-ribosylglycohydrolase